MEVYYHKNDTLLRVTGVQDKISTNFGDDTWTLEVTVKDDDDNEVSGQTWPASLTYESGTDGDFHAVLEDSLDVQVGDSLVAELKIQTSTGFQGFFEIPVVVKRRQR